MKIKASTPSRICLFGEHQDYLSLQVISSAINLRFSTTAETNGTDMLNISILDESLCILGTEKLEPKYNSFSIDLSQPIVYENSRDYFKSVINVLRKEGFEIPGANITMDSEIPIGKGMCSSTTMVLVLIATLAALTNIEKAQDVAYMAILAWKAEVEEFNEPGGLMDHYSSALGGLVHLDFSGETKANQISVVPDGCFILFDSLQQKDTIKVLSNSKYPTLEGLSQLAPYGVTSISDFYDNPALETHLVHLDETLQRKVKANINNYRIQREAYDMFNSGKVDSVRMGELLNDHYANLRDGLGISTDIIDSIIDCAIKNGAYGGKFNGSGGGGCLYVYAAKDKAQGIIEAVKTMGYPGMILVPDKGLTVEEI